MPTLFIAGNRDAWINEAKVGGLKEVGTKHNLPVEVVSYDADHAFFNDTRPEVYDAEAAKDAWQRVLEPFQKIYYGRPNLALKAERPAPTFPMLKSRSGRA